MMLMTQAKMLSLLPADPEEVEKCCQLYDSLAPKDSIQKGKLVEAARGGQVLCRVITINDTPGFMVFYTVNSEGVLYVNAVQTYGIEKDVNLLFQGIDLLAKNLGCKSIRCTTVRSGLAAKCIDNGYRVSAVVLTK